MCNNNGGNIPGAKGCPNEMLKEAGENGVSKINVDTDLRLAMLLFLLIFQVQLQQLHLLSEHIQLLF